LQTICMGWLWTSILLITAPEKLGFWQVWATDAWAIWMSFFFFCILTLCGFLLSYYYCTGDKLWHLQKFLQYIIVEFTPPLFSIITPPPIPGIVSTGLIFTFSYMTT
jgi:hypothetical protein